MCDVGYLCANFILPRPHCSPLNPDVTRQTERRQTDVRRASSLNASAMWGRGHNKLPIHRQESKSPLGGGAGAYGVGALQTAQLDTHDPSPSTHKSEIAAKANQRANSILRCFTSTYVLFLYLYIYTTSARILFSCVVAMCEQMIITHAR